MIGNHSSLENNSQLLKKHTHYMHVASFGQIVLNTWNNARPLCSQDSTDSN